MIGKGTKAHKIVSKASEKSATGTKIRAGAALYVKAKKGHPQSRKAIKIMAIKAKKGDPQAIRDINAVKAGRIAVRARARAKATREVSMVIQRRPHCSATYAVVPEPQVGSRTRSPGSVAMRRQRWITSWFVWTTYCLF